MTCDVTINHVHLTDIDIGYFDAQFRLDPSLRQQRDREGLKDGTIDAICSDLTPLDDNEKLLPFAEATSLELLLSLTLKWAREANVPLATALARITSVPADVLKLPAGIVSVGFADLCIFGSTPPGASIRRCSRARAAIRRSWATNCLHACARRSSRGHVAYEAR